MVVEVKQIAGMSQRSRLINYLPAIYADSDFMRRFLLIFESVSGPIDSMIENIAYYFDPRTTPEELLPWLATWVNIALDDSWPVERRRSLVQEAVHLFRWRGTRRGLIDYLQVYAGVEPEITENFGGIPLGANPRLEWNTVLGSGVHNTFSVVLRVDDPQTIKRAHVKSIIESVKPAHTAYSLQILPREDASPDNAQEARHQGDADTIQHN
jgi:phage tail-like protein